MRGKDCTCHGESDDFDVREAYRRLSLKHDRLAIIVSQYISEAGLERPEREKNAEMMANTMFILNGEPTKSFGDCGMFIKGMECTGVLVHPRIMLTAAHCYSPPALTEVAFNCININDSHMEKSPVQLFTAHPAYGSPGGPDIAVVILPAAVHTPHAVLATTAEIDSATEIIAVGFGDSELGGSGQKRMVKVRIKTYDDINQAEAKYGFDSKIEFTAGDEVHDTCSGDSGGPAYIEVAGQMKLAALTSRGINRLQPWRCGAGGIYTRVDRQLEFIRKVAGHKDIVFP